VCYGHLVEDGGAVVGDDHLAVWRGHLWRLVKVVDKL
jgi:hypothetical protein